MRPTIAELHTEIKRVAQAWPAQRDEPNLQDLHWLAVVLNDRLALELPNAGPPRERGVELVELVEGTLLLQSPDHMLRLNTPDDLVRLCDDLMREIRENQLLRNHDATNLVTALLGWVGCLRMAKSLRVRDSAGQVYTDEIRRREYATLSGLWNEGGGRWIRYGATLAHDFETGRGNEVVDEWVPADSPYRMGLENEHVR